MLDNFKLRVRQIDNVAPEIFKEVKQFVSDYHGMVAKEVVDIIVQCIQDVSDTTQFN